MTIHRSSAELLDGLDHIRRSPRTKGTLDAIVRRPKTGQREILEEGSLDIEEGLVGDNWRERGRSRATGEPPPPDTQLNIMNSRVIALLAQEKDRWALAGDQLFVDLDLSEENLPAGTRLALGDAVIEVSKEPHTGCHKFGARFGIDAVTFVNSAAGKQLRLRGLNARVVQPGIIRVGDRVKKLDGETS